MIDDGSNGTKKQLDHRLDRSLAQLIISKNCFSNLAYSIYFMYLTLTKPFV
jgi:hypothetical protein